MDPHRWATIQSTFDELVDLDGATRASRLTQLGSTDPELRAAVESLLTADADASAGLAPLEAASDPFGLTGRTISHFRVLEPLGAGGMGVVYRGQDTRLGRTVALKFLLPHFSLDASAKARFLREARAAAALDHPHVCTIYDVGESADGRVFLAMALYVGETLKARLARDGGGPLPVAQALDITRQIASGLGCAHAAGIVHRDLTPGNVMLLPNGTVRILDFGLAKARDDATGTSAAFGTVAYMAPERFRGEAVDARADLWALGVLLYEMVTGRKPFVGEHEVAVADAIAHAEPVAPATLRAGLPAAVQEVVLTLLQKDPTSRYAAADDVIADLAAVGSRDEAARPGTRPRPLRTRASRPRPATRWMVGLAGVLLIGGVLGTAIARWLRPGAPPPVSWYSVPVPDSMGLAPWDGYRIAISPGGDRLVYVGPSPQGGMQLWLRSRDQLRVSPLAGTERAVNPFFSRDGTHLGFVVVGTPPPRGNTAIKVLALDGRPPTMVTDSLVDLGGAAWGYDGYIYFDGRLEGNGIARVRERGGVPEPVTMPDHAKGEMWHQQPEPLPNRQGVLFGISGAGAVSQYDIGVVDLRTGRHRVLVRGVAPHYAPSGHLVYVTAAGTLMAAPFDQDKLALTGKAVALAEGLAVGSDGTVDLAISATGTIVYAAGPSVAGHRELVWVTRAGQATPIDTAWRAADFSSLALSPDGAELAVAVQDGGATDLWIKRLDRGPARKLTFEGDDNERPAWTADGRAVTFVSNGRSQSRLNLDLYVARVDGTAPPRMLLHEAAGIEEAQYSRDGKWLVYRKLFDLFAVRTDPDATPIQLTATPFNEATPTLSPGGRWLAYSSDESGRREVYVRPFPNTGSTKWQVSAAGGAEPVWSRNGGELFYKAGGKLLAAVVLPGPTFGVGDRRVLFSVTEYDHYWMKRTYDVSPDGRRFVMIRSARKPRDELIVAENVFEGLRQRVKP